MRGLIAFTLAAPLQLGLTGCERAKTKLDREVDRLCAIDGGVHIYETVTLSKENFGPNGEVFPKYRGRPLSEGRFGPDYDFMVDEKILIAGDPSLHKSVSTLVRKSDAKILGSRVNYVRRGGDWVGPWHDSAKSCLDILPTDKGLELSVFVQKEESK